MVKQVRIQSDGDGRSTVVTLEDGTELKDVASVVIWLEARELNRAEITVYGTKVDVHSELEEVVLLCPFCADQVNHKCKEANQ